MEGKNLYRQYRWIFFLLVFALSLTFFTPVHAVEPGEVKWQKDLAKSSDNYTISPFPAISNEGTIYLAAPLGNSTNRNALHAINPDGSTKWVQEYSYASTGLTFAPSIGPEGNIYITGLEDPPSNNTFLNDQSLYAFTPNGDTLWKYPISESLWSLQSISAEGKINLATPFANSDSVSTVFSFNSDGTVDWKQSSNEFLSNAVSTDNEGNVYINLHDQEAIVSYSRSGQQRWAHQLSEAPSFLPGLSSNGGVYVLTATKLKVLNASDGSLKWEFTPSDAVNPQFPIGSLVIGPQGTIVLGGANGVLTALNADGSVKWSAPGSLLGSSVKDLVLGDTDTLYVLLTNNNVVAMNRSNRSIRWTFDNPPGLINGLKLKNGSLYATVSRFGGADRSLISIETENVNLSKGDWPLGSSDNKNTFRLGTGQTCNLSPKLRLSPPILNQHFGHTFVFLTGFEESDNQPSNVEPSSVKLSGAEPEKWHNTPHFLWLKYDNKDIEIGETSGGWFFFDKTELDLEGELSDGGCFETSKEVFVW